MDTAFALPTFTAEQSAQSFYTNDALRSKDPKVIGSHFEALFYRIMFREMRESALSEGLFDTYADEQFTEMFHDELAQQMGQQGKLGIVDLVVSEAKKHPDGLIK